MNVNSVASYLRGKNRDVAVSYEDYLEITDCLLDQYLSREMMMNFKNCTEATHYEMTFVPIYAAPFAGLMTKFLFNFTDRKGGLYK